MLNEARILKALRRQKGLEVVKVGAAEAGTAGWEVRERDGTEVCSREFRVLTCFISFFFGLKIN